MDKKQFIATYLIAYGKYFSEESYPILKLALEQVPARKIAQVYLLNLKSRITVTILSLCTGVFAADRFYLGDKLYATIKLVVIWLSLLYLMSELTGYSDHIEYEELLANGFTEQQIFALTFLASFSLWAIFVFLIQVVELFLCYHRVQQVNLERLLVLTNQLKLDSMLQSKLDDNESNDLDGESEDKSSSGNKLVDSKLLDFK